MQSDDEMIKMSTLSRKNQIAERLSGDSQSKAAQEQMNLQMEEMQAKIREMDGKTEKYKADVAKMIAENPSVGTIMDSLKAQEEVEEEKLEEAPQEEVALQSPPSA